MQSAVAATPVRVRIGIHTGEPMLTADGYVGIDVHRAARIAAAGHGGQVLASEQTARLAGDDDLRPLGTHRLKDLTAPERIYQLGPGEFPPLKTLDAMNLPVAAGPLIGRRDELAELMALLRDGTRIVTVTGPGGTGKTRFALQAAAEVADDVFWVPLQALSDPELVPAAIAETVGAGDDLGAHLRARQALVLLDSLEHLLPAARRLAELVARCADLRLLITSRRRCASRRSTSCRSSRSRSGMRRRCSPNGRAPRAASFSPIGRWWRSAAGSTICRSHSSSRPRARVCSIRRRCSRDSSGPSPS